MQEQTVPEWIAREEAEIKAAEAMREANWQRDRADLQLVRAKSPEFWGAVRDELQRAARSLERLGARATISGACPLRIDALRTKFDGVVRPAVTYTDLFFEGAEVRVIPLGKTERILRLCPESENEVRAWDPEDGQTLTAGQVAERIMRAVWEAVRTPA